LDFGAAFLPGNNPVDRDGRSSIRTVRQKEARQHCLPWSVSKDDFAVGLKITAFRAMLVVFRHWSAWPDRTRAIGQVLPLRRRV